MLSEKELADLREQTVEELHSKVVLGSLLIKQLVDDPDERAEAARERLRVQQEQINALIAEKVKDTKPEETRMEMKPATFAARGVSPIRKGSR